MQSNFDKNNIQIANTSLDLALLYKKMKNYNNAKELLSSTINIYKQNNSNKYYLEVAYDLSIDIANELDDNTWKQEIINVKYDYVKKYKTTNSEQNDIFLFDYNIINVDDQGNSQFIKHNLKIGRNNPCICGSGRKYKKCCGKK